MYKSYQLQLVLMHAQVFFASLMANSDYIMNIAMISLKSTTFGIESIESVNYFNIIPWFFVFQFYVLLIPKAVSMFEF